MAILIANFRSRKNLCGNNNRTGVRGGMVGGHKYGKYVRVSLYRYACDPLTLSITLRVKSNIYDRISA